ncbi:MAG: hypothetical protein HN380_10015 [Victivallales bacterium]|nr:hypothetical protein [Victivallales bacterium]
MIRFPATILVDPVVSPWLIGLVVVGVAYGSWRTYQQCSLSVRARVGLWLLRVAAVLILSWLLLLPKRRTVRVEREDPVLAIAVDISASMADNPGKLKHTRQERAVSFLADGKVQRLCKRYRVVHFQIGAETEEAAGDGDELIFNAPRSHIGSGINRIVERLRADNLAGIILLSDGLDQSGERLTPAALATRIYIPELELPYEPPPEPEEDWYVADVSYPKMMVVNWKANVDVLIRRRGKDAAEFPIHLRQGGRPLRTSIVSFAVGEAFQQVSFSIEPTEVGQLVYEVEIGPGVDGEPANNKREFLIEVNDPKNRVLYLEGVPRWAFKFLKRALLSEKNYQLSAFVQGGNGAFINFDEMSGQAGGEVPKFSTETLSQYRVVVLGDMGASALSEEDCKNLQGFVNKGGGLLFYGAQHSYGSEGLATSSLLAEMMPAVSEPGAQMREGRFTADLSAKGRTHPALAELASASQLPPILSFWSPVKVSPFASKLLVTADGSPVLVTRPYGQGRVAMVLSDSLWRWQLGGSASGADKSLYGRFVTQLVYWLAPSEKDLESTTMLQAVVSHSQAELRQKVTIGAVYDPGEDKGKAGVTCKIATPAGKVLVFPMMAGSLGADVGLTKSADGYKCFFTPQDPGQYQITLNTLDGNQEATATVLAEKPENERTSEPINRKYLSGVSADTGGAFVEWPNRHELFDQIRYQPKEVTFTDEYPIWNRWWWLVILLTLFCVEWWWRRRSDLV